MKKIFIGAVAICMMLMVSCSGSNAVEKGRDDSARIADSISQVEAAKAAAEQARLDSIRQDSIRRDSISKHKKIMSSVPSFNTLYSSDKKADLLKSMGYDVKSTIEVSDVLGPLEIFTAKLKPSDDVSIQIKGKGIEYEFTVNGSPELLNKIFNDAKKWVDNKKGRDGGDEWIEGWYAKKRGNTIIVNVAED